METHRNISVLCFLAAVLFLIITIVLEVLDSLLNNIFYDISIAIFTGLFVSLILELAMYNNEKSLYIHKVYNKLVLIYKYLLDINCCSIMQKSLLNTNEIFNQNEYWNIAANVYSEELIKIKNEIDFSLYSDFSSKNKKSKFKRYLSNIQIIFIFDLERLRNLNQNTQKYLTTAQTIIVKKDAIYNNQIERIKVDLNVLNANLQNNISNINECLARQEELSSKLLSDIESNIIALREMYNFEGDWNSEKEYAKKMVVSQKS